MVRVTRIAIAGGLGVVAFLAAALLVAQDDECSRQNLEACVNHEWERPIRGFTMDELKEWHKAFYYADWERNHDATKKEACHNNVKTMGLLAFNRARYTESSGADDDPPPGGWVYFMFGEDVPDMVDHVHGAYYPYTKKEDGVDVRFSIIVMNWDLTQRLALGKTSA